MHIKYKTGPVKIRKFEQIRNKQRYWKDQQQQIKDIQPYL